MNEFIQLIIEIFEHNDYFAISDIQSDNPYVLKHKTFEDFWIVAEGLSAFTNQDELYDKFNEKFGKRYPLAEKNTSLLLLVDTDKQQEDYDAVKIENDSLFFKKYVLPYTGESFHVLKEKMKSSDDISFEDLIMKDESFVALRRGEGYAVLLYTIVHKLPFLPIQVEHQQVAQQNFAFRTPEIATLFDSLEDLPSDMDNEVANAYINNYLNADNNDEH